MAAGDELPGFALDRPEVYPHLWYIWEAFHHLSRARERQLVDTPKGFKTIYRPLRFADIDAMATRIGIIDFDEFADFHYFLSAMDGVFLTHTAEG
jgi:hypothetical protein